MSLRYSTQPLESPFRFKHWLKLHLFPAQIVKTWPLSFLIGNRRRDGGTEDSTCKTSKFGVADNGKRNIKSLFCGAEEGDVNSIFF